MIDVFKVGVTVAMHTNSAEVLSKMIAGLTGVHIAAGRAETAIGKIRAVALGAGAVFAGWAVVKGLVDATKHAEKLNHELVKLQTGARLTDAQTDDAKTLAFQTSRNVPGSNVAENVKVQRELFGVFGDMDTAKSLLETVVRGSRATSNFVDKDTDLAQIAVRALELRGHITKDHKVDPKEFAEEFNSMVRSIVASEGLVDPQKLFMFIRQAGPAARNMSGEQMWGMAPAIMNALGSGPAGTATMSLFQQFIGHVVAGKRVAIAMEDAGMLTPGKWKVERGGKVRMDIDAVPDQAGFMDHPFTWLHEHLQKMREKKDAHGKPVDILRIVQEIFQISSRQTTARLINDIDSNWPIIENEERRWKRMPNIDVIAKEQNDKDLSVNVKNLHEAWDNFMTALGGPGVPVAIAVLHKLTDGLNWLQEIIIKHPTAAADLFYIAGGLGALTALGGSLVILNATWAPLVAGLRLLIGVGPALATTGAGLTALAGGLGTIVAFATGPAAAALLALKIMQPSKTNVGEENTPGYKDRFGSVDPNLNPNGKSRYVAPPAASAPLTENHGPVRVIVENAKDLASGVSNHIADKMSRPQSGPTGPDLRYTPPMPGMGLAY